MAVECNEIEIVPESPWRHSFRKMRTNYLDQLKLERSRMSGASYSVGGSLFFPREMSDNQIDWLARQLADRDVSGAIRQQDSTEKTALHKRRRGQAV